MFLLKLYEMPGTKTGKLLGTLKLKEVRRDGKSGTVAFDVMAEDETTLATAQVTTDTDLPWKAAMVALNKLYGPTEPFAWPLREDGICNALTSRGSRCQIPAKPMGYYCLTHDPVRSGRECFF